jgi:hypothetical protein
MMGNIYGFFGLSTYEGRNERRGLNCARVSCLGNIDRKFFKSAAFSPNIIAVLTLRQGERWMMREVMIRQTFKWLRVLRWWSV